MKVAAQAQSELRADELAKMFEGTSQVFAIIVIALVGMRRRNHALDAIFFRQAAHFLRDVPGLGTVVNLREDVGVDVDHGCR